MEDQDWKISVEKKLTSIGKDIEYIKLSLLADKGCIEKHKGLKGHINVNRWLIGGLFSAILTVGTVILTR